MATLTKQFSNSDSDTLQASKNNKSPSSYARLTSRQNDSDDDKQENKQESAVEIPLIQNEQTKQTKTLTPTSRDVLNDIYDEVLSDEEDNEEPDIIFKEEEKQIENKKTSENTLCIETNTNAKTNDETCIQMVTKTNSNEKQPHDDIFAKIHQHKSVLDTTMHHGERLDSIWSFINWRIIIQVGIALTLASMTYFVEFAVWRLLQISQCKKDIVYLSINSLKYSIYDMWQAGFCFLFAVIYLLTATIINYGKAAELGIYSINIRKLRFYLLCITMLIAFCLSFFVSFYDPLLYNFRLPIFIFVMIIFYYLCLCKYRKIVIAQAYYILWPFAAYVCVIVIIYAAGLAVAWLFRDNGYGFATVYPIYIGLAQTIGIAVMKYYHYLLCCFCKKKYSVAKDYDPNSYYEPQEITQRYICTDAGGNVTETDSYRERKGFVDGRAVEYLWVDEWLYFICGVMIVFTEAMRLSGLLAVKDNTGEVIVSCVTAMVMEILQRNNLIWELLYRLILRKPNPDRCKFDAMYYGAKYSWEYLPIALLFFMDLMQFGPTNTASGGDCNKKEIDPLYQVIFGEKSYWYIFILILGFEILTDLMCEFISWLLRKCAWIPILSTHDGARKIILIRLGLFGWTALFISAIQVAQVGYSLDFAISNMLHGEWQLVDDYSNLFF